jgi:hypothetical protein
VYIASDGSIGETVDPVARHCIKCAAINSVNAIKTPARQTLTRECAISGLFEFFSTGSSMVRGARTSLLAQPSFMIRGRVMFRCSKCSVKSLLPNRRAIDLLHKPDR